MVKMMKKKKLLLAIIASAMCLPALCGCLTLNDLSGAPVSDYTSATEVNTENLMTVRSEIRSFNIAIDTLYYRNMGWISSKQLEGMGSGVVFEEDETYYYALTNQHVITNVVNGVQYSVKYTFTDINGTEYSTDNGTATLVMSDATKDIAIVKMKKISGAAAIGIANYTARADTNLVKGEFVLAVGNPSGVNNIVTYGQVTNWAKIQNVTYQVINHTALINPGNSGGALCDIDGNLLGLNTWGTEDADDNNFAIPLSIISAYIDSFHAEYQNQAA